MQLVAYVKCVPQVGIADASDQINFLILEQGSASEKIV